MPNEVVGARQKIIWASILSIEDGNTEELINGGICALLTGANSRWSVMIQTIRQPHQVQSISFEQWPSWRERLVIFCVIATLSD